MLLLVQESLTEVVVLVLVMHPIVELVELEAVVIVLVI